MRIPIYLTKRSSSSRCLHRLVVVNQLGADMGGFLFSMASVTQMDQFGGHEIERDSTRRLDIPIQARGGPAQLQVLLTVRASLPTNKFKCPVSLR
jgi:hypothetical protein